jgi:transcriptional regulator NrdR family protein
MVRTARGALRPFDRDKLFISIYESCRHRPTATADATALTETIISQILVRPRDSVVEYKEVADTTRRALQRFDKAAATIYAAYHPI